MLRVQLRSLCAPNTVTVTLLVDACSVDSIVGIEHCVSYFNRTSGGKMGHTYVRLRLRVTQLIVVVLVSSAMSACSAGCELGLSTSVQLASSTIRVGQTLTPEFTVIDDCRGGRISTTQRWWAEDTLVIHVDSATGRVTGRTPGTGILRVRSILPSDMYTSGYHLQVIP